ALAGIADHLDGVVLAGEFDPGSLDIGIAHNHNFTEGGTFDPQARKPAGERADAGSTTGCLVEQAVEKQSDTIPEAGEKATLLHTLQGDQVGAVDQLFTVAHFHLADYRPLLDRRPQPAVRLNPRPPPFAA